MKFCKFWRYFVNASGQSRVDVISTIEMKLKFFFIYSYFYHIHKRKNHNFYKKKEKEKEKWHFDEILFTQNIDS